MKHTKVLALTGTVLALGALMSPSALAGGISLYEVSTPDVGLASAGYAAGAQDASTLFKNPAGMSLLNGPQLNSSLQVLYGSVNYTANALTTTSGGSGNNAVGALPGASFFLTYPVSEKLTVGFGSFSYFGLAEDYGDNWAGRYYMQKGTLMGMSLMPAASFKVNDWLCVGGGLNAMLGYLDGHVAVRQIDPIDGQMKIEDTAWGFGGNFGIMIQPQKGTRIGINYLTKVDLDFSDKPSFSRLGPAMGLLLANPPTLDLGTTVPQSVMVGIYQEINAKWAVMADVGWQDWSQFSEVTIGVDSANPSRDRDLTKSFGLKDTWHGALGAGYKYSDQWRFTGGFAYDTSAVSDANRVLALPVGEAYRFGLGAFWKVSQSVDLGAAYEFVWAGDMPVTQSSAYRGTVSGSFDNVWFSFFSVNLNWHF